MAVLFIGEFRENPYIDLMHEENDPVSGRENVYTGKLVSSQSEQRPILSHSRPPVVVPIRSLGANHRERIATHLLTLDARDRYLRFGYAAGDEHIRRYVEGLDFDRDEIFGIYNRKLELIAIAHLAYPANKNYESCAEFGVSVAKSARGRGFGARLFERAAMHARNDGITQMFIHALSENIAMLKIARSAGAIVQRDGSESEAYLRLSAATLDSQITEIVQEQLAQADYRMKEQAQHFWRFLKLLQNARVSRSLPGPKSVVVRTEESRTTK